MEGRLDMATRKRLANRFKAEYAKGTKRQKGEVLDRLVAVGMGRSTARRLLSHVLLQCLFDRFGSVFPQCGLMVFPGVVIVSR